MVIRGFWEALGNRSNRSLVLGGRRSFGDAALLRLPTSAPASERGYGRNRDNWELLAAGREIREAFGEEPLDEFSNTNVVLPSCLLHIVDDASMQAVRFGYDGIWADEGGMLQRVPRACGRF